MLFQLSVCLSVYLVNEQLLCSLSSFFFIKGKQR